MPTRQFLGWCILVTSTLTGVFGAYLAGIALCSNGCASDATGGTSIAIIIASVVWAIIGGNLIWN